MVKYIATIGEQEYLVEILDEGRVGVNGKIYQVDLQEIDEQSLYSLLLNGRSIEGFVYPVEKSWQVLLSGRAYQVMVEDERGRSLRQAAGAVARSRTEVHLKAPMPGLVVEVRVVEGQPVAKGEVLLVLESMKMQNELKAPQEGVVSRVRVEVGDRVEQHQTLITVS